MDEFRTIVDVNLIGAFAVTQAAAPQLLDGGGAVLMVASTRASPRAPASPATAAPRPGWRTWRAPWPASGAIAASASTRWPGLRRDRMTEAMLAVDRLRDEVLDETPLGRLATLEEVVRPALFLLSDEASYITGAVLAVDGGMAA